MDNVRDWDVLKDGPVPVAFMHAAIKTPKDVMVSDENGDHYGVMDGATVMKVMLVKPSPVKAAAIAAADLAAKPARDKDQAEFDAARFFAERTSDLPLMNDDEWAQLKPDQKTEHVRNVMVGLLGQKLQANELLDAESESEPGLFSKLWSKFFG